MSDITYDVVWARPDGELMRCSGLTPRVLTARLIQAVQNSGRITVHSVTAQGMGAGTAETVEQGSVHESPVGNADAPMTDLRATNLAERLGK